MLFLTFWRNILRTSSKRPEKTSVGWFPWDVPRTSVLNLSYIYIFTALFLILFLQICAWRVSCILVLGFWRNVLNTSSKGPKVTSSRWRPRDVPRTSILNISTKRISVVTFSVLVHQMYVLDNKKLVIAYSFSFGETSYERHKNVPKWHLQRDVCGTSSGRQFKHFP